MSEPRSGASAVGTWTTVGLAALLILVSILYVKVRAERDEARSGAGTESSAHPDGSDPAGGQLAAARSELEVQAAQAKLAKNEHAEALARLTQKLDAQANVLEATTTRLAVVSGERDRAQRTVVDLQDALAAVEATLIRRERELARTR